MQGTIQKFRSFPADTAARITRSAAMERGLELRYRSACAMHALRLPPLAGPCERIVAAMRSEGVCVVRLEELAPGRAARLLQEAQRLLSEQKGFFVDASRRGAEYLIAPADALQRRPLLYRFGLSEPLLDIVEAYVGLPVGYDGVVLQYTPADGRSAGTRAWHRDREDRTVVKVAVYLNEVNLTDGPFELLPDPHVRDAAEDSQPITCTGPAGTVVFADTARFLHRGRPITGRPRAALFFSYFARRPRDPWYCARTGITRAHLRELTAGLSQRQRDAALWRRNLPLIARIVPAAPL